MSILGIEEIFLAVKNMEKSIEFYNGNLGIPIDKQHSESTYLQTCLLYTSDAADEE